MRWIACLGQPLAALPTKQVILKNLSKADSNSSIVFSDFKQIKVARVHEFWTYPELVLDFLRDKPNWCFVVDRGGDVSYEKHQEQVTFVTDFFSDDPAAQWGSELKFTEALKRACNEFEIMNAFADAEVQAFGVKNNFFAYCRKSGKPFFYSRFDKYTHILTDDPCALEYGGYKKIWTNTQPTVISLEDYTIIRETK